jgi:Domain of unknown function (DUF4333)
MPEMSRLFALLLGLALAVAACSNARVARVLSASDTARQISAQLGAVTGGTPPTVRCPTGIKSVPGRSFDCSTTLEDQPLTIHVTLNSSDGSFTPRTSAAVVSVPKVVGAIKTGLAPPTAATTTISCGRHNVLVVRPGTTFTCSAVSGTASQLIQVTVLDLDGRFRYQPAPAASG